MEKINNFKRIVNKLNDILFIILASICARCSNIPLIPLGDLYEKYIGKVGGPIQQTSGISKTFIFVGAVILAPIIESLFLILVIRILKSKFKIRKQSYVLIITAIIFSCMHYYSLFYIIVVFIPGLIFVYSYMYYQPKRFSSFWVMTSVHSLYNLVSMVLVFLT